MTTHSSDDTTPDSLHRPTLDHSSPAHIVHRVQRDIGSPLHLHEFLLDLPCHRLLLLLLCPLQLHAQLLQLGFLLLQGLLQLCRPVLQQDILKVSRKSLSGLPCQMSFRRRLASVFQDHMTLEPVPFLAWRRMCSQHAISGSKPASGPASPTELSLCLAAAGNGQQGLHCIATLTPSQPKLQQCWALLFVGRRGTHGTHMQVRCTRPHPTCRALF